MGKLVATCYLLLFFFSICKCDTTFSFIVKETNWEQKYTRKIVNFLSEKLGYNKKCWIDPSEAYGNSSNYMQLHIKNGEILCKTDNSIVEFKAYKQTLVKETPLTDYYNIYVHYVNNSKYLQIVNPIPLSVPKHMNYALTKTGSKEQQDYKQENEGYKNFDYENFCTEKKTDGKCNILGEISEGYLVCEKTGNHPLLIPKYVEEPEFLLPPWTVQVDIVMFKNPVMSFGRQYVIVILDDVNILKNKKKFFFWPAPLTSMTDVYFFHLAMKASKKGKFCSLSRIVGTGEIQLYCEMPEHKFNINNINSYLTTGLFFMNLANIVDYPFLKLRKLKYIVENSSDGSTRNVLIGLGDDNENVNYDKPKSHVTYIEGWKIKKKLFFLKNLVYICAWSVFNILYRVFYFTHVRNLLREANQQLKTADIPCLCKLEYPIKSQQTVHRNLHYMEPKKKKEKEGKKKKEAKGK